MEPYQEKTGEDQLPIPHAVPSTPPKPVLRLSLQQREVLEFLYRQCPEPTSAHLQQFIKDRPALGNLDIHRVRVWFECRRMKERRAKKLSPLISKNAELKAEHEKLLLLNNQLRSQSLLLNLENQRLKEQLEIQLQLKSRASSQESTSRELPNEGYGKDVDDGGGSGPSCEKSGIHELESNFRQVKVCDDE